MITQLPTRLMSRPEQVSEALGIPFSDEQLAAITAPLEPTVIIAGAGSGKTTVMAARVVWLVGTGQVSPDQVLGLTFTRKAAGELAQRVRTALTTAGVLREGTDEQGEEVIMTYDAFAGRLLAEHGQRIGAETDPMMITGAARFRLADRVVREAPGPLLSLSRLRPATLVERLLALDAALSAHLVSTDEVRADAAVVASRLAMAAPNRRGDVYLSVKKAQGAVAERLELLDLVDSYAALKRQLGLVEFADQMALAARIVAEVPAVAGIVREQFHAVLLDEYQDTSAAQASLLQGLFAGDPVGHPVTAVGDPFQAIYGWRGAAASNILHFHSDFPRQREPCFEPAVRVQLSVNRRSGQRILDVANELATPLRSDPMLRKHDQTGAGTPQPLVAPPDKQGGEVRAASFTTWPEESGWVADRIVDLRGRGRLASWKDCAVLLRRNSDMAEMFAALSDRGVPTEIVGLGGLLELPEVAAVVATLRLIDDVTANPALVHLLSGPRWRIGQRDLALLGQRARDLAAGSRGSAERDRDRDLFSDLAQALAETDSSDVLSLLDAVDDPGDLPYSSQARTRFAAFGAELARLRRHSDEPVLDQLRRVIAVLGLDVELATGMPGSPGPEQLAAFTDAVAGYVDVDAEATLSGLIDWLDAERDFGVSLERATPSERNSVKLLTVHRAKGLEWDVVFLPGLVDKVFPSDRVTDNWTSNAAALPAHLRGDADSIPQVAAMDEPGMKAYGDQLSSEARMAEDRLGYVAVTRAREVLIASCHTWKPGAQKPRVQSPYFEAVATEAIAQGHVDAVAPPEAATNPLAGPDQAFAWPVPAKAEEQARRRDAADLVERARQRHAVTGVWADPDHLPLDELAELADWDATLDLLEAEAMGAQTKLPEPDSLSASMLVMAGQNPSAFARQLVRPMPHPASRAAALGTRFHAWVQRHYGLAQLVDPLVEAGEEVIESDAQLAALQESFLASDWASRTPVAVEVPFALVLGSQVIRGQIDAAFDADDGVHQHLLVDWKTSERDADDLQLAIYRQAWALARGVDPVTVDAVFVHVRSGRVQRPAHLATREELEQRLVGGMKALDELRTGGA
ncbi:ATP-dependent helicase [Tessaracoccus sp. SD287]|uniref:ATP-dependent DNA helicase n=1 Tax=Tessaracoccus sp. SD287 TaxID=2782008 RepID=UPI001A96923E|nr:ATP-dependent DNA helicase [Tessaracoccus sp. SD287]MBO1030888.1 ATP-dependent helicase [Tessaracoccus sp. SD287]